MSSEVLSRHRRTWIIDSFEIEEENQGPFPYALGKIQIEREYQTFFELFGEGVDEEPMGVLSIHKDSGELFVHKAVDYEERTLLKLRFQAKKTDLSIDTRLGIEIYIRDINDNPPLFQRDLYEHSVGEESTQGSNVLTVFAHDRDKSGSPNSTFHYEIKSVSPNVPDTKFFIDEFGGISFKGCLDHEVTEMFTILVEAKDHGEVIRLSSSTTVVIHVQDGNNHLPIISGQTGSSKVTEHEVGSSPLRLHVTDKDSPNSRAWKAKYTIHGDEGEHFRVETDPDTNDGILTVVKALDFEAGAQRELSISVENEAPYFSCKVKDKPSSGLWTVETTKGDDGAVQPHSVKVTIEVEDANDPPVFSVAVKEAVLEENAAVGTWVEKVTAVDPDSSHARDFVYKVGHDPAGWVTVDPHTGDITTVKPPDRESPHVVDGLYTILLHAVDDGEPPQTGTATLQIHVADQNDNVPQPTVDFVDVCMSDSPTTTNITAFDPDGNPFGGPFTFELLGNVNGKWKLNPAYGFTAGLVKESSVYAGPHTVNVKISDMQGQFGVYNLSVTVCDCTVTQNCRSRRATAGGAASGALGVVFGSLFLLLFMLLMAVFISCKTKFQTLPPDDCSNDTLLKSNTEKPGTDCKVPDGVLIVPAEKKQHNAAMWQSQHDGRENITFSSKNNVEQGFAYKHFENYRREDVSYLFSSTQDQSQMAWNSLVANGHNHNHTYQSEGMSTMDYLHKRSFSCIMDTTILNLLHSVGSVPSCLLCYTVNKHENVKINTVLTVALHLQKLSSLQETENDLLDYEPHLYAEEGDSDSVPDLEKIPIPDDDSFQKALKDLGPSFNQLASICQPPKTQN
ncbi:cadherin-like protein 26 [Stegastes partitus]|uniref:Cadherin-like protein 26 n=1 Tax=Stegastes partitus TaxID=144197 RepID=A0A9Y4NBY4_9TELE|nr:PREDICTED: cadherin-like protein 26 [Stegastes partitus]